jgi:hypothetical protein
MLHDVGRFNSEISATCDIIQEKGKKVNKITPHKNYCQLPRLSSLCNSSYQASQTHKHPVNLLWSLLCQVKGSNGRCKKIE